MSKTTKIPRILKINQIQDWNLDVVFNNGEYRKIDFEAFFKAHHFADDPLGAQLLNPEIFQTLILNEGTLSWPSVRQKIELRDGTTFEVPFDLDPIVLYNFSTKK